MAGILHAFFGIENFALKCGVLNREIFNNNKKNLPMKKGKNITKGIILLLIGLVIGTFIGIFIDSQFLTRPVTIEVEKVETPKYAGENSAQFTLAALDGEGKGVTSILSVTTRPGKGLVFVNINNILADYYTQYSAREAVLAVEDYLGVSLKDTDVMFQMDTGSQNLSVVGGPSAGAAMAVTTIAALENKTIKPGIMMTGTINREGFIGQVGGVLEKAKAAKAVGATLFLVPPLQVAEVVYERHEECQKVGGFSQFCRVYYTPKTINVEEEANISMKQVKTLGDAVTYFFE